MSENPRDDERQAGSGSWVKTAARALAVLMVALLIGVEVAQLCARN